MADKAKAKAAAKPAKASTMTKSQIIGHMAEKFGLSRRVAGDIIQEISDMAVSETKKAGQFVIPGIGKLVKAQRKARVGINPKTKEKIKIPAKTVVKFRVSKATKEAISPSKK
jgi:DNA-binding protein HU-beta